MKKILFIFVSIIAFVTLTGCFADANTEIEFVSIPKSVYKVGYSIDTAKSEIFVKVKSDGNTQVLSLNSNLVTVTGLDFSQKGTFTMVVKYNSVSISYEYMVIESDVTPDDDINFSWYVGKTSPYYLNNVADLLGFAAIVNGKAPDIVQDNFVGKTIYLTSDVDLSEKIWTPIGEGPRKTSGSVAIHVSNVLSQNNKGLFQGVFDGLENTINGLSDQGYVPPVNTYTAEFLGANTSGATFGFFGRASNATIKNLIFTNTNITGFLAFNTGLQESYNVYADSVGVVLGLASNNVTIENCHVVDGLLVGDDSVGTFIGRAYTGYPDGDYASVPYINITNCSSSITIDLYPQGASKIGKSAGLLGYFADDFGSNVSGQKNLHLTVTFTDCVFTGKFLRARGNGPWTSSPQGRDVNMFVILQNHQVRQNSTAASTVKMAKLIINNNEVFMNDLISSIPETYK